MVTCAIALSALTVSKSSIAKVYIFILDQCPIADQFLPIIGKYEKKFSHKGVMFDVVFEDSSLKRSQANQHLKKYGYLGAFKLDCNHALAKKMGATTSPEVFLFTTKGSLLYHGRIDDRYLTLGSPRPYATNNDLTNAINEFLNHKQIKEPFAKPIGCLLQL